MSTFLCSRFTIVCTALALLRGAVFTAQNTDCSDRLALYSAAYNSAQKDALFQEIESLLRKPIQSLPAGPPASVTSGLPGWGGLKEVRRCLHKHDFKASSRCLKQVLDTARRRGDRRLEMLASSIEGSIARTVFPAPSLKAIPHHERALVIAQELRDSDNIILQLLALADNYGRAGQFDCFLEYVQCATRVLADHDRPDFRVCLGVIFGCFLAANGEWVRAEKIFRMAIPSARKTGDPVFIQHLFWQLYWLYIESGNAHKAEIALDSVQAAGPEVMDVYLYEMRRHLDELHKDQAQPFPFRETVYQFLSTEYSQRSARRPADGLFTPFIPREELQLVAQKRLLSLLNEQKKERIYLGGLIALVSILLFISLIIWYKGRQAKRLLDLQLLNLTANQEWKEAKPGDITIMQESDDAWLQQLHKTVRENLSTSHFSVNHLAELMAVSRTELYHKVHEKAHLSVNQFIQEMRLLQAQEMLESGQYGTLQEVAEAVGFRSANYLSRLYRARFGKSPAEYLNKAKGDS